MFLLSDIIQKNVVDFECFLYTFNCTLRSICYVLDEK